MNAKSSVWLVDGEWAPRLVNIWEAIHSGFEFFENETDAYRFAYPKEYEEKQP